MSFFVHEPAAFLRIIICWCHSCVSSILHPISPLTQVIQSASFPFLYFFISAEPMLLGKVRKGGGGHDGFKSHRDC